jgi:hypothetical protein
MLFCDTIRKILKIFFQPFKLKEFSVNDNGNDNGNGNDNVNGN